GLGGDAAAVQARTAHLVALDQHDPHAELGGAQGARIPAAPAAEYDKVVSAGLGLRHRLLLVAIDMVCPVILRGQSRPSATSCAIWTRVRTATPVPPFAM